MGGQTSRMEDMIGQPASMQSVRAAMQSVTTAMPRVMLPVTSQLASRTSHHGALRTHLARQAYSPESSDESSTAPDEASAWSAETMGERSVFTRWASAFAWLGRGTTAVSSPRWGPWENSGPPNECPRFRQAVGLLIISTTWAKGRRPKSVSASRQINLGFLCHMLPWNRPHRDFAPQASLRCASLA